MSCWLIKILCVINTYGYPGDEFTEFEADVAGEGLNDAEAYGLAPSIRDLHASPSEGEAAGYEGGLTTGCRGHRLDGRKTATKRRETLE